MNEGAAGGLLGNLPKYEEWAFARDEINRLAREHRRMVEDGKIKGGETAYFANLYARIQPLLWGADYYGHEGFGRVGAITADLCAVVYKYEGGKPKAKFADAAAAICLLPRMLKNYSLGKSSKDFWGYYTDSSVFAMSIAGARGKERDKENDYYRIDKKRQIHTQEEHGGKTRRLESLDELGGNAGRDEDSGEYGADGEREETPATGVSFDKTYNGEDSSKSAVALFMSQFFRQLGDDPARLLLGTRRITSYIIENSDNVATFRREERRKDMERRKLTWAERDKAKNPPLHYHVDNLGETRRFLEVRSEEPIEGLEPSACKKAGRPDCGKCDRLTAESMGKNKDEGRLCSDYCVVDLDALAYAAEQIPRYMPVVAYWIFTQSSLPSCEQLLAFGRARSFIRDTAKNKLEEDRLIGRHMKVALMAAAMERREG